MTFTVIAFVPVGPLNLSPVPVGRSYYLDGRPAGDTFADTLEVALLGVYGHPIRDRSLIKHKGGLRKIKQYSKKIHHDISDSTIFSSY